MVGRQMPHVHQHLLTIGHYACHNQHWVNHAALLAFCISCTIINSFIIQSIVLHLLHFSTGRIKHKFRQFTPGGMFTDLQLANKRRSQGLTVVFKSHAGHHNDLLYPQKDRIPQLVTEVYPFICTTSKESAHHG